MSFTVPLTPRTQLYNRSCSNKHNNTTTARRNVATPRDLPPLNLAYEEYDNNERHINGVA
jgi:hypothetical protein